MRRHHDQWVQPQPFKCFSSTNPGGEAPNPADEPSPAGQPDLRIQGLAAYDPDAVVWQQGGTLYACGPDSDAPIKVWESEPGNRLLEFAAAQPRKVLVHCRDTRGEYLALCEGDDYWIDPHGVIRPTTSVTLYASRPMALVRTT